MAEVQAGLCQAGVGMALERGRDCIGQAWPSEDSAARCQQKQQ
jgi:hypothetical protein